MDLIDFLMDVIEEESHMDEGQSVRKAAETIINAYGNSDIISVVESFIKRGRFTLAGDKLVLEEPEENTQIPNLSDTITTRKRGMLSVHNQTRVRIAPENAVPIKKMIVDVCESFKAANNKQLPSNS